MTWATSTDRDRLMGQSGARVCREEQALMVLLSWPDPPIWFAFLRVLLVCFFNVENHLNTAMVNSSRYTAQCPFLSLGQLLGPSSHICSPSLRLS